MSASGYGRARTTHRDPGPGLVRTDARCPDQLLHAASQFRAAGRGIVHLIQLSRKSVEIMDGFGRVHGCDEGAVRFPSGRKCREWMQAWAGFTSSAQVRLKALASRAFAGVAVADEKVGMRMVTSHFGRGENPGPGQGQGDGEEGGDKAELCTWAGRPGPGG